MVWTLNIKVLFKISENIMFNLKQSIKCNLLKDLKIIIKMSCVKIIYFLKVYLSYSFYDKGIWFKIIKENWKLLIFHPSDMIVLYFIGVIGFLNFFIIKKVLYYEFKEVKSERKCFLPFSKESKIKEGILVGVSETFFFSSKEKKGLKSCG